MKTHQGLRKKKFQRHISFLFLISSTIKLSKIILNSKENYSNTPIDVRQTFIFLTFFSVRVFVRKLAETRPV